MGSAGLSRVPDGDVSVFTKAGAVCCANLGSLLGLLSSLSMNCRISSSVVPADSRTSIAYGLPDTPAVNL